MIRANKESSGLRSTCRKSIQTSLVYSTRLIFIQYPDYELKVADV